MTFEHRVVFVILGAPVTTTVVTTSIVVALLLLGAALVRGKLQVRPSRWQAALEWGLASVTGLLGELTGSTGRRYLPLVATVGVFVLALNLVSALPLVEAPTADLNTPVALAVVVFFAVHFFGIQEKGLWPYVRSFAEPVVILFPINVLSHLTRTVSLAIRLFGNMISHQIIVAVLLLIVPLVVPAVLEVFGLFIGVIQAYIFTILTVVYIGGAVQSEGGAP
jgi:F-type H+-transporting ATPase subunit a